VTTTDPWTYRTGIGVSDIVGYDVEAVDGAIGEVNKAGYDAGVSYIVVHTGPWVLGKRVMLPAVTVERVDHGAGRVWVNQTRDQILNAPDFDPARYHDSDYRNWIAAYYTGRIAPARGRFRYRLVDLAGKDVGGVRSERALRADDRVAVPSVRGENIWRVVAVLGKCATVAAINRPDTRDTSQDASHSER
jgi:hypothetical protein